MSVDENQEELLSAYKFSKLYSFLSGLKKLMIESTLAFSTPFFTSLSEIRSEVRALVERNLVRRNQSLYCLCEFIPPREWDSIESELEKYDYLLRDCIGDLLSAEKWEND